MFWFEVVSGLEINMGKSELVLVGVVPNIADMVDVLGCKRGFFPMKYLGLLLGANVRGSSIWYTIIEKMERRLAGWRLQTILNKFNKTFFGVIQVMIKKLTW